MSDPKNYRPEYDELAVVIVRWSSEDPGCNTIIFDRERPETYYALLDWAHLPDQQDAHRRRQRSIQDALRRILGDDYTPPGA